MELLIPIIVGIVGLSTLVCLVLWATVVVWAVLELSPWGYAIAAINLMIAWHFLSAMGRAWKKFSASPHRQPAPVPQDPYKDLPSALD